MKGLKYFQDNFSKETGWNDWSLFAQLKQDRINLLFWPFTLLFALIKDINLHLNAYLGSWQSSPSSLFIIHLTIHNSLLGSAW